MPSVHCPTIKIFVVLRKSFLFLFHLCLTMKKCRLHTHFPLFPIFHIELMALWWTFNCGGEKNLSKDGQQWMIKNDALKSIDLEIVEQINKRTRPPLIGHLTKINPEEIRKKYRRFGYYKRLSLEDFQCFPSEKWPRMREGVEELCKKFVVSSTIVVSIRYHLVCTRFA